MILLTNGGVGVALYDRERVLTYLLWGGAAVLQLLLWVAVAGILAVI